MGWACKYCPPLEQRQQRCQRLSYSYLRQRWEVGDHRPPKQAYSSSWFVGLAASCLGQQGRGPPGSLHTTARGQRLTLPACKERPPAVTQLLGAYPSGFLEDPGWLCPPTEIPGARGTGPCATYSCWSRGSCCGPWAEAWGCEVGYGVLFGVGSTSVVGRGAQSGPGQKGPAGGELALSVLGFVPGLPLSLTPRRTPRQPPKSSSSQAFVSHEFSVNGSLLPLNLLWLPVLGLRCSALATGTPPGVLGVVWDWPGGGPVSACQGWEAGHKANL